MPDVLPFFIKIKRKAMRRKTVAFLLTPKFCFGSDAERWKLKAEIMARNGYLQSYFAP